MLTNKKSVAVVGAGYWGKNLVRNFHQLGVLKTVCDRSEEVLGQIAETYAGIEGITHKYH